MYFFNTEKYTLNHTQIGILPLLPFKFGRKVDLNGNFPSKYPQIQFSLLVLEKYLY
jgi:hypothetical protein